MSSQPGFGAVVPLNPLAAANDEEPVNQDEGVPVGASDVEADKQNAEERSESSSAEEEKESS